jgi:hypothetical protein
MMALQANVSLRLPLAEPGPGEEQNFMVSY